MIKNYRIWRRNNPLELHVSKREVTIEYAISAEDDARLRAPIGIGLNQPLKARPFPETVEIYCIRDTYRDDGVLPRPQWAYGGEMPAPQFIALYYPVAGW